jgi:hypothetical protein
MRICLLAVFLSVSASASLFAQEASIVGTVIDESKSALPGVTVLASDVATGRAFNSVSDERGEYRLVGMSPGHYTVRAELSGFATSTLSDIELLVGQNANLVFTMKIASLNESVTVTGEAPLIDTRQAQVAGNVDRRQMEELPINGRNWLQLSTMVKGVTANAVTTSPGSTRTSAFRVNLDGQEVTQETSVPGFGQPGISRDAIAEYQIITNLFDITMGRSIGLQVQAVSRSGANKPSGSFYGYFRDDKLNSADAYTRGVLPYSNTQIGGTQGGAIIKDRLHYFVSYEYQTEPDTSVLGPAVYNGQTISLPIGTTQHFPMGRVDLQMNGNNHLTVRGNYYKWDNPQQYTTNPQRAASRARDSRFATGNWSHIYGGNLVQEVRLNYFNYYFENVPLAEGPQTPEYIFPALTLGPNWNYPEFWHQRHVTATVDLKWHKGSHDVKFGSDIRVGHDYGDWFARQRGQMYFSSRPADVVRRFPLALWDQPSQWDLSGLDATATRFDINYARNNDWSFDIDRPMYAGWLGDSWTVNDRLTLNAGVRYDVAWNDFVAPGVADTTLVIDNGLFSDDYGYRSNIRDLNNISTRGGFAWKVNDGGLVIRGGSGLFYSTQGGNQPIDQQLWNGQRVIAASYLNDGRPGFVVDPTRGITTEQVLAGAVALPPQAISVIAHDYQMPYTWQSMLGFQKQINTVLAFDADLVGYKAYHTDQQVDPNLFYDPATGLNKNPLVYGRPNPAFGQISLKASNGYANYLALASSLTRRYRNNFQFGMTYTYMFLNNDTGIGNSGYSNQQLNPFDIGMDYGRSAEFQRHTVNANGIVNLPLGILVAGAFHYGSGNYTTLTAPTDPLGINARRVLADLTILDRNTFLMDPYQSLDLRLSKEVRVGALRLTGMAEMFNVYDYKRFNRNTNYGAALFGAATSSGGSPRTGQLAFRISF